MHKKIRVIKSEGGYSLCQIFVYNESGDIIPFGFVIFNADGSSVVYCETEEQGLERLDELIHPFSSLSL